MASKSASSSKSKSIKARVVRDSFTMPGNEYAAIAELKQRCLTHGIAARKSEILRAALASFSALDDAAITRAVQLLEVVKTGRPAKNAK